MRILIISIYIVFWGFSSFAQTNCNISLRRAEQFYDQGKIEDVPDLLKACIEDGFSKPQKIRAYELIILSYLVDDEIALAEEFMIRLLKLDAHYNPDQSLVNSEFINLYNEYETKLMLSVGIKLGTNFSHIQRIEEFGIHNLNEVSGKYYTDRAYNAALDINTSINQNIEVGIEIIYSQLKYNYELLSSFDFSQVRYSETHDRLDVPLCINFNHKIGKFVPFVKIGGGASLLLKSEMNASRFFTDNSNPNLISPPLNNTNKRTTLQFNAMLSLGTRYIIDNGYLFFDSGLRKGLQNSVVKSERYNDYELMFLYHIIDDDFYINRLFFSVGYTYTFYKPRKLKK
jgi:hypothetical protein